MKYTRKRSVTGRERRVSARGKSEGWVNIVFEDIYILL